MNLNCYKIVFSKRLGMLVAVGEHTSSTGKAASGQGCRGSVVADSFVGALRFTFASVALACLSLGNTQAQSSPIASTALPQGGSVSTGSATISTQGAAMAITQSTDKASINWQSFNIGSAASVNIAQPSANSVLLNRVVGNDPSQILGQLKANGQVILLNPNGVLFGKDGSVTASSFTASTFALSDADFMAGYYKYKRNGSTAAVVNQGTIETSAGGFVALIGATVTNEGTIRAPQGDVVMAAAESVTLPEELVKPQPVTSSNTVSVRMSKRVRLELDPAAINTAVNNTESGVIVTEGGQVLLQAAAISSAVASVTHSGRIDTSAPQAGAVTVLADNGVIKVDGSIKANSSGTDSQGQARTGGDIIIGRDIDTGVLAKTTNVTGAALESQGGFVETSGEYLDSSGVRVKAAEWLLDPNNIEINLTNVAVTAGNSVVLAGDIANALTAGTTVTISTGTGAGSTSSAVGVGQATAGTGNTSAGTIAVNSAITSNYTGATNPVLTLSAASNINVSAAITATGSDIVLKSTGGAISNTAAISGRNVSIDNTGGTIDPTNGAISKGGSAGTTGTAGINVGANIRASGNLNMYGLTIDNIGINIANSKTLTGDNIQVIGQTGSVYGVSVNDGASIITTGTSGDSLVRGIGASVSSGGFGALQIGSATFRAATGSTLTMNGQAITVAADVNTNTRGIRVEGTVDTYGDITLTGTSGSNDGFLLQSGQINVREGALKINGTIAANGGGWRGGVVISQPIYLYNGASLTIVGKAANTSAAMTVGQFEQGVSLGGSIAPAVGQTSAGDISITGYTSSAQNSVGALINGNISTAGNIKITGQALGSSTGNSVNLNSVINSTSGNVTIQSIGGKINQAAAKTITARNITIDNTGAGLSSLIADTTAGLNLSVGTLMGGSINNATGAITPGSGKAVSANGITIAGGLTASNNLNLYGISGSANGITSSAAISGAYINAVGKSLTGSTGYAWNGGNISTTGTGGLSTDSTLTGISDASVFTSTSGYGAFNMYASAGVTAFSGTSLSLVGNATTIAAGATTNVRGWRINGGSTLTTNGNISITGTSNNDDGLWIGGSITRTGAVSQLTLSGTTASSVNAGLSGVYLASGSINGAAATGAISINGTATNTSGASTDNAVRIEGTVTGGSASAVNIQGSSGNVVTGAAISANSISLSSNNGSVSSSAAGTLAVGASGVTISSATAGTLAGAISGTGPLTKTGAGTTTLTASNTYTGTTTVSAGTLQAGNGGATGTLGSSNVVNNAALIFNRDASADLTVASAISGSGTLTQAGAGKTILTSDNTYTGATTISGGTLQIGNGGATGNLGSTSGVTLSNNANLTFNKNTNTTIDKAISGNGNVTANITGDLALGSNIALTGTNTISLTASGAITQTTGSLAATNLYMTATSGDIGTSGNRIQTSVNNLSLNSGGDQYITETDALTVGAMTTNNGSIDIATTNGILNVNSVNSINGVSANGTGNVILSGTASGASNGLQFNQNTSGYNLSLTGVANGSGNAIDNAGATLTGRGTVSLTGTSAGIGAGIYSFTGTINGAGLITLNGTDNNNQGLNLHGGLVITNTGTFAAGQDAIWIKGASSATGVSMNGVTINNNSTNGNTRIDALNGGIDIQTVAYSNAINNASSAGQIVMTTGNGSPTAAGNINLGNKLTITQNSNAGVLIKTSGTGNITVPKIINNGTGDVVVAAGSAINAGTDTGGQVLTLSGNTITNNNGKTYIYSGNAASTGVLSNLRADFATLYYQGSSHAVNTAFNKNFDGTPANDLSAPAGGSVTTGSQVFFRSTTKPGFSLAVDDVSKTYGDADHTTFSITGGATTLTNAYAGVGGNNTFAVASSDVLAGLTGTRAVGENVGSYAFTLDGSAMNATLSAQPKLNISKRNITLTSVTAADKVYDGNTVATINGGVFGNLVGAETLSLSGAGVYTNANAGNGKALSVADPTALTQVDGTGLWSNYNLTTAIPVSGTGNITAAPLSITVNNSTVFVTRDPSSAIDQGFTYSGFVNGETAGTALTTPLVRQYVGPNNPAAGTVANSLRLLNPAVAANGNYTITEHYGDLTVLPATSLLINVSSQSATYGSKTASNASIPGAGTVSAQYCLTGTCIGSDLVNLSLTRDPNVANQWLASDGTGSTIQFATGIQGASYSMNSGYLKAGNYAYDDAGVNPSAIIGNQNYNTASLNTGVLTITPLAVSLTNTPVTKPYDGTTALPAAVLPNNTLTASNAISGDDLEASFVSGSYASSAVSATARFSLLGVQLSGADAGNYSLANYANTTYTGTGVITGGGGGGGGGTDNKQPIIHPPKPIIPTDNASEGGGGGSGGGSSGNPYLVIPSNRANSADRCTPNTLEECLCESQDPKPVEGLAICYQPKKTASTPTVKARRG